MRIQAVWHSSVTHAVPQSWRFCWLNLTVSATEWYVTVWKEESIWISEKEGNAVPSIPPLIPPPPKKRPGIEVLDMVLPFLSRMICVDGLKLEDAGPGSSSCAGLPLVFPPLFLQQPCSLTTDRWPRHPVGSASHLCLFIGFASFLTLRSSPEFHLLLAPQLLKLEMVSVKDWTVRCLCDLGLQGEVVLPLSFGLSGCSWFSSGAAFVSQAQNLEWYWLGPVVFKLCSGSVWGLCQVRGVVREDLSLSPCFYC